MSIRDLFERDDAVSPVIGVILMVAITVILAAVIASFVLNVGDQAQQSPPQASFDFEYQDNSGNDILTITHESGETVNPDNVYVKSTESFAAGPGNDSSTGSFSNTYSTLDLTADADGSGDWVDENLKAGVSFDIVGDSDLNSATVRLIYEHDGQTTTTIATWEGPDA
ncbi:type IV pilin [Halomicrobium salinisoli]|uniref:type IV pilin n=1 Tax=Halomicrobium salinisoli TaxID=2878391 RepID=UPI001CF0CE69|nr:type IV pilin N-terminal domain-containing protein [Halomicrobium salinisoli]